MSIHWSEGCEPPLDEDGSGLLVTHLKDSGRGVVTYRSIDRIAGQRHLAEIPVPFENALEIQTLRLASVRDMGITYLRLRTACVRLPV